MCNLHKQYRDGILEVGFWRNRLRMPRVDVLLYSDLE